MILWILSVRTKIKGLLDFHLGFHQEDVVLLQEHLSPENAPGTNCGALTSFQGGGAWVRDINKEQTCFHEFGCQPHNTWQGTKTSLTYSHLITKQSHLAIIWATESKPWLVAMWMQKFRWLYLWKIFHGELLETINCFNCVAGTNFFLVHPSSLNRQV